MCSWASTDYYRYFILQFQACVEHRDELSLALIMSGASIDLADNDGRTALIEATADHEDDVAKLLIVQGADLNVQDRLGRSALIEVLSLILYVSV